MSKSASEGFTALPPDRSAPENIFDLISLEGAAPRTQLPPMPDVTPLEIKVQPADNIFAPAPPKNPPPKYAERQAKPSFFLRFLGFTARMVSVVFLCLLAWAAGAIYARQHLPADLAKSNQAQQVQQVQQVQQGVQQSAPSDQMVGAMQQMNEQIRALEIAVNKGGAAQATAGSAQTSSNAAIADLAGRVDKLQTDLTTKLSQINEQLAHIEQQVSAPRPALTAREHPPRKRPEHYHDAFDPSRDPTAPGAPHPIGAQ